MPKPFGILIIVASLVGWEVFSNTGSFPASIWATALSVFLMVWMS